MFFLLLTAVTYFYYNRQYFSLIKRLDKIHVLHTWFVLVSFAVNYLFFFLCSILEFPLIMNWFLFAFLLFFETLLYNKGNIRCALFGTLMGIIYGLAANIFCRSLVAITMNQMLQSFDNHVTSAYNMKSMPVCLGFLLAGLMIRFLRRPVFLKRFRLILGHPQHHAFLLEIMAGLFFYLFLNLLPYSAPLNNLILKVWSIKSSLFCLIGLYIAVRYTRRICELDNYRMKNLLIEQELEERQWEEERLKRQAVLDDLTGCYNRQYAEETLDSLVKQKLDFSLCFLDLDGLKNVNDRYGHEEGDRYLLTAAGEIRRVCRNDNDLLFRYGGDEFLAIFVGADVKTVEKMAETVNHALRSPEMETQFAYPLSLSYGVAESAGFSTWADLVAEADRRMYAQKKRKHIAREDQE